MSEFNSLKKLRKILGIFPKGFVGPGDDCALIPWKNNQHLAISSDSLVEGIHFYPEMKLEDLLYKSLQVNLSDLASKGAKPLGALFSLSLPRSKAKHFDRYLRVFAKECGKEQILLLGGDSTASLSGVFISVTVFGLINSKQLKLRSHVKPSHIMAVTDFVGDSSAGLELLNKKIPKPAEKKLVQAHLRPKAELLAGEWLASQKAVGAMMDLSDGLGSDLQRMAEMSQCGFEIELESIPLSPELNACSLILSQNLYQYALGGGEDYKLLCSVEAKSFDKIQKAFFKKFHRPLYKIGHATKEKIIQYKLHNKTIKNPFKSFEHFPKRKETHYAI